jgi:hypothetical protein
MSIYSKLYLSLSLYYSFFKDYEEIEKSKLYYYNYVTINGKELLENEYLSFNKNILYNHGKKLISDLDLENVMVSEQKCIKLGTNHLKNYSEQQEINLKYTINQKLSNIITEIFINENFLVATDNMHRTWEFDILDLIQAGKNKIKICFSSSLDYIQEQQNIRRIDFPTMPGGVPAFSQIRKASCSFGWDWGPCFATCGIWRPISIVAVHNARLNDIVVLQDHSEKNLVKIDVKYKIENFSTEEKYKVKSNV